MIGIAILATVAYVGAGFAVDARRAHEAIEALGWLGCGLVLGLSVLNYLVRFQRWQMFLSRLGHRLPGMQHLLYYLSGFAFTVSPAKMGEALRSVYLRSYGVTYSESVAALFLGRPDQARAALARVVAQDPDDNAWHHLQIELLGRQFLHPRRRHDQYRERLCRLRPASDGREQPGPRG